MEDKSEQINLSEKEIIQSYNSYFSDEKKEIQLTKGIPLLQTNDGSVSVLQSPTGSYFLIVEEEQIHLLNNDFRKLASTNRHKKANYFFNNDDTFLIEDNKRSVAAFALPKLNYLPTIPPKKNMSIPQDKATQKGVPFAKHKKQFCKLSLEEKVVCLTANNCFVREENYPKKEDRYKDDHKKYSLYLYTLEEELVEKN